MRKSIYVKSLDFMPFTQICLNCSSIYETGCHKIPTASPKHLFYNYENGKRFWKRKAFDEVDKIKIQYLIYFAYRILKQIIVTILRRVVNKNNKKKKFVVESD